MDDEFANVDWDEVAVRLTLVAARLFALSRYGDGHVLASYGTSPEDLAAEAIVSLVDRGSGRAVWNHALKGEPTTAGVVKYLTAVVRNDFRDQIAASRRKRQTTLYVRTGDGRDALLRDPPDEAPNPEAITMRRSTIRSFKARVDADLVANPDEELKRYLDLLIRDDEYFPHKPRDAAEALGLPTRTIYLIKDRFDHRVLRIFGADDAAIERS